MKRQLCVCALFALVLVPDWASACWPRWGGPVPTYYHAPMYYAPPPVYCPPVYVPCAPAVLPPPRVEPSKPRVEAQPTRPPQIEPVRPAAGVEVPKVAKPEPAPAPLTPEQKIPPIDVPKIAPEPKLPPIELPKSDAPPKLPPLELPKDAEPKLPSIELPKVDSGLKLPGLELPGVSAVPVPAPAPDALPPLTLPPDTPVAPDAKPTEAKSSPLTAREPKVSVFPASGVAAERGLRKVGFYNHTDRDLALTIEGKAVTLPAKTYLHAQLPSTFTWAHGDKPAAKETVPADASGVDVLFKSAE